MSNILSSGSFLSVNLRKFWYIIGGTRWTLSYSILSFPKKLNCKLLGGLKITFFTKIVVAPTVSASSSSFGLPTRIPKKSIK